MANTASNTLSMEQGTMGHILLVEDDHEIAQSLGIVLKREGYHFSWSASLAQARDQLGQELPDLVILDLGLPDGDGGELAIELRAQDQSLPIIMFTARDSVEDIVAGLDSGADDYLVKPIERKELVARIRSALRRSRQTVRPQDKLTAGNLILDLTKQEAQRGRRQITLTKIEFKLLEHLMLNQDKIVSRSDLLEEVWGYSENSTTNTIDVFISTLRRKLEADGESRLLYTSYGRGYIFRGGE